MPMSFRVVPGVLVWPLKVKHRSPKKKSPAELLLKDLTSGEQCLKQFPEGVMGRSEGGAATDGVPFGFDTVTTNLYSFVAFGKTQKLHRAIDHRVAGVTWQAHFALDGVTKGDTAVQSGRGDDGENKEVSEDAVEGGEGRGGTLRPPVGALLCTA